MSLTQTTRISLKLYMEEIWEKIQIGEHHFFILVINYGFIVCSKMIWNHHMDFDLNWTRAVVATFDKRRDSTICYSSNFVNEMLGKCSLVNVGDSPGYVLDRRMGRNERREDFDTQIAQISTKAMMLGGDDCSFFTQSKNKSFGVFDIEGIIDLFELLL